MSSVRRALILAVVAGSAGLALTGPLYAQSQPKLPSPPPVPRTQAPGAAPAAPAAAPAPAAPAAAAESAPGAGPRDPFAPLVQPQKPEERQAQEITGLKLVGVLWDPRAADQIRALVETPDGLGYYLRVNDEKFGGTVTAIERNRVMFSVRETVPGGPTRVRTVELKLPQPNGQ
jgi:hypothetical protein